MNTKIILLLETILLLVSCATAILTRPMTENTNFGCQWTGGMESALICHCQPEAEVFHIKENSIVAINLHTIQLSNCNEVIFDTNAIQTMRSLRQINLDNIRNLSFEEYGLLWTGYVTNIDVNTPTLRVSIKNSNIDKISSYTFNGMISHIDFENVVIKNISPFGFSSLTQSHSIEFLNVTTENVQPQAFKKFLTEQLVITNSNLTNLPSRSFSELTVNENFLISNSTFGTVKSGAFFINNPRRFEVVDSKFHTLEGEAFRVMTRGDVLFKNDYFFNSHGAAFLAITVNFRETNIRSMITFNSLTFDSFNTDTLEIDSASFDFKLVNIHLKQSCDCTRMDSIFANTNQLEEFYCLVDERDYNYEDFKFESCSLFTSNATIVIIVCVILMLALIIGAALWCYFKKVYRCDRYGREKDKKKKLSMIVPDGRTYRETELHVIVERTDLLTTDL